SRAGLAGPHHRSGAGGVAEASAPARSSIVLVRGPALGRRTAGDDRPIAGPYNRGFPFLTIMTDQFARKSEAWSARFSEPVSELVKRYTASVGFDKRLAAADIEGSLAHAAMLEAVGILSQADLAAIRDGMDTIRGEIARGEFEWSVDLEDVHLNI